MHLCTLGLGSIWCLRYTKFSITDYFLCFCYLDATLTIDLSLEFFGFVEFLKCILMILILEQNDADLSFDFDNFFIVSSKYIRIYCAYLINLDDFETLFSEEIYSSGLLTFSK